jgi:micrococcal nuclease
MARRIRKRTINSIISLVVLVIVLLGNHYGWFDGATKTAVSDQPGLYSINHFVDGDTIAVNMNGTVETVRFIGIDTPETHKPNTPVQCYGPAAAAHTKTMIGSGKVRLESDPESTNRDRYNRLLRYVYLQNGTLLNKEIVADGYGFYYPYFPFTKSSEFEAAEKSAQATHKGLWGNCHPIAKDKGGYVSNNQ